MYRTTVCRTSFLWLSLRTIQIGTDSSNLNSEFCFILKVWFSSYVALFIERVLLVPVSQLMFSAGTVWEHRQPGHRVHVGGPSRGPRRGQAVRGHHEQHVWRHVQQTGTREVPVCKIQLIYYDTLFFVILCVACNARQRSRFNSTHTSSVAPLSSNVLTPFIALLKLSIQILSLLNSN